MNFKNLRDRVAGGVYDVPGELYPRETLKDSNPKKYRELRTAHRLKGAEMTQRFSEDLREAVQSKLNKRLAESQWKATWNYVYDHGHSSGYHEIVNVTISLTEILKTF